MTPDVHYVLPDGFRGAFLIYTNASDGILLAKTNGRYICDLPENGILRVQGEGPFYSWHTVTASFRNGQDIPVASAENGIREGTVAFWDGGSRPGGLLYDFIGTRKEKEAFDAKTETGEVKPGAVKR